MSAMNFLLTVWKDVEEWPTVMEEAYESGQFTFMEGQLEMCPDTAALHIQVYVECKKKSRISAIKLAFKDETLHAEVWKKNICTYCSKEETRIEGPLTFGDRRKNEGGDRKSNTFVY